MVWSERLLQDLAEDFASDHAGVRCSKVANNDLNVSKSQNTWAESNHLAFESTHVCI